VLAQHFFGLGGSSRVLAFDVALHFGTLLAVVYIYRKDLWDMLTGRSRRLLLLLGLATLPAVAVGLGLKPFIEKTFVSPVESAVELLVTGVVLWGTKRFAGADSRREPGPGSALAVGAAQAVAILPGISRSGMTIAAGLFCGFSRETAARFSFLMSIPAIAGACLLEAKDLSRFPADLWPQVLVGTAAAAVAGFLSIRWLLGVISRGRLHYFAYYCWAVGLLALLALLFF
jgi:undecaprenyl-diphosphatase